MTTPDFVTRYAEAAALLSSARRDQILEALNLLGSQAAYCERYHETLA